MSLFVPGTAKGIVLAIVAFALFSLMDVAIKWLSGGYPLPQIVLINSLVGLLPIFIFMAATGGIETARTRDLPGQVLRAAFGLASGYCAFYAYTLMPLADAYAIMFSAPLFITALSVPMLGEAVGWRRWSAVLVGFAGVMVMLKPGEGLFSPTALAPIGAALCYAIGVLIVRRIGAVDGVSAFVLHGNLIGLATSAVLTVLTGVEEIPPADIPIFLVMGLCAGTAILCLIGAFRMAPAAVIAPFQFTQMLWAVVYGSLIWGDWPSPAVWLGSAVVLASGVYVFHREAVRRRDPIPHGQGGPST